MIIKNTGKGMAVLLLLAFAASSSAQTTSTTTTTTTTTVNTTNTPSNSSAPTIYVELGGPGLAFSGNFDMRFGKRRDGIGGRVGLGLIASDGNSIFTAPVQLNYLLGKNGKYFEMGAGATYASISDHGSSDDFLSFSGSTVIGTMTFGYRSQPVDGGFNFRASFNPLFNSENFVPFFGISFGYSFR